MKTETLKQWIEESKSVIIYHKDGSACQLTDEDVKMITDALGKQIPKKPREDKLKIPESYEENYYCPNCGLYLTSEYEENFSDRCDNCGQLIDWSDEE